VTQHKVGVAVSGQKPGIDAKGGRDFKVYWKGFQIRVKVLKED
jgi:hypothetical protein